MKEIFISHSSLDKEIVNDFIDEILMAGLEFSRDQIYSTSADDLKNKPGQDWENGIKEALCSSKVIIIMMTLNYRKSEFCLCELGITWATSSEKNPIYFIVDPVSFDNVPGVLRTKEVRKLLDAGHLNNVKDFITDIFKNKPSTERWENKRNSFLGKAKEFIRKNPSGKLGLVDSYPKSNDAKFLQDMFECIEHAKEEIKLVGLCLNFFVTPNQEYLHMIIKKSKEKTNIKPVICFGHPNSHAVISRKTGDYSKTPIETGLSTTGSYINNICSTIRKEKGNVKVKCFDYWIEFATLIFDNDIFVYPYGYKIDGTQSPVFHFYHKGTNEVKFFIDSANRVIDEAKAWPKNSKSS